MPIPASVLEQQEDLANQQHLEDAKLEINQHMDDEISRHFSGLSGHISTVHGEIRTKLKILLMLLGGNFFLMLVLSILLILSH